MHQRIEVLESAVNAVTQMARDMRGIKVLVAIIAACLGAIGYAMLNSWFTMQTQQTLAATKAQRMTHADLRIVYIAEAMRGAPDRVKTKDHKPRVSWLQQQLGAEVPAITALERDMACLKALAGDACKKP